MVQQVTPATFQSIVSEWNVSEPAPPIGVDCSQSCAQWGWKHARVPCEADMLLPANADWRGFQSTWNGSLCRIDPARSFRCCFLKSFGRYAFNMTRNRELSLNLNGRPWYPKATQQQRDRRRGALAA